MVVKNNLFFCLIHYIISVYLYINIEQGIMYTLQEAMPLQLLKFRPSKKKKTSLKVKVT